MTLGQSEIEDTWLIGWVDDDVAGLQIAVDDALGMGGGHRSSNAQKIAHGSRHGQRPPLENPAEREAGHIVHRVKKLPFVLAPAMDRDDARMAELARGPRLEDKTLHVDGVQGAVGQHHLQGDQPAGSRFARPIDHAHAAAGNLPQQLVVAERPRLAPAFEVRGAGCGSRRRGPVGRGHRGLVVPF